MDTHFGPFLRQIHADELRRRLARTPGSLVVLDARPADDFSRRRIPGSRNLRAEELGGSLPPYLSPTAEIVVVGRGVGDPSRRALAMALQRLGARRVLELAAGIGDWILAGGQVEGDAIGRAA